MNKAENVEQVYDDSYWLGNVSKEGCYSAAVYTAHELGGIEIYNSNDGGGSWSFAPTRTFEFDDLSSAQVMYSGVFVIMPNQPY